MAYFTIPAETLSCESKIVFAHMLWSVLLHFHNHIHADGMNKSEKPIDKGEYHFLEAILFPPILVNAVC